MDDAMRKHTLPHPRTQKHKNYRHLQTDLRSVGMFPRYTEMCCRTA
jgi:hypothetical protein